jgi:hypothetical protein
MNKIIFSMILLQALSLNALADNVKNVSSRNEEVVMGGTGIKTVANSGELPVLA